MVLIEDVNVWAQQLLESRGALVEPGEGGVLRAMLPPPVAGILQANDWLQLRFGAGAGADDPVEWLDRLAALLPSSPRLATARLRHLQPAVRVDAESILAKELVLQNGICRWVEDWSDSTPYLFFTLAYVVESSERIEGLISVAVNPQAASIVMSPERLLALARDAWIDDQESSFEALAESALPIAFRIAAGEARRCALPMLDNASRRLGRDVDRVTQYYAGLLDQIEKRRRKAEGTDKESRERDRATATAADRAAKLDDLRRKHAVKVRIRVAGVLAAPLPVRAISVRLLRKKADRQRTFHWNPILREMDMPWCEGCHGPASPIFLCDDRVHCLCRDCLSPCPACSRPYCRACHKRCKCGAGTV